MEQDIVAKINEALALFCGYCHTPLREASYSLDFCCEEHQREWQSRNSHPLNSWFWQAGPSRSMPPFDETWTDDHLNTELLTQTFQEMGRQFTRLGKLSLASMNPGIAETQRALRALQPLTFQRPPDVTENDVKANALQWAQRNRNVGPRLPPAWMR